MNWNEYALSIAEVVARKSKDPWKKVGCVLLIEKGKLVRYADGYGNETAEREIKRAEDACAGTTGKGCEWAAGVHPGPAERVPQRASGEGQKRRSPAHSVNEVQASDAVQSPINRQSIANRSADRGQKNPAKSTKISQDLTRVEKEREVKRSDFELTKSLPLMG